MSLIWNDLAKIDDLKKTLMTCCTCGVQLREPVQLRCLHNCCAQCVEQAKATTEGIVCPICHELTGNSLLMPNLFLTGYARLLMLLTGSCQACSTRCGPSSFYSTPNWEEAESFCLDCMTYLCTGCLSNHVRFATSHITVPWTNVTCSSDIAFRCFPLCQEHGESFSRVCLTCESLLCRGCISRHRGEDGELHDLRELGSSAVREYAASAERKTSSLLQLLERVSRMQAQSSDIAIQLKENHEKRMSLLRQKKKDAIDTIESEYRAAEAKILCECETTTGRATEIAEDVQQLLQRLTIAEGYCRFVVDSGVIAGLVCQNKVIEARLTQLDLQRQQLENSIDNIITSSSLRTDSVHSHSASDAALQAQQVTPTTEKCFTRNNDEATCQYAEKKTKLSRLNSSTELELDVVSDLPTVPSVAQSRSTSPTGSSVSNQQPVVAPFFSLNIDKEGSAIRRSPCDSPYVQKRILLKQPFKLKCDDSECRVLVVASDNLRRIGMHRSETPPTDSLCWHRVAIDRSLVQRVVLRPHYQPVSIGTMTQLDYDVCKEYKLLCKQCRNDWGIAVRINGKFFFILKIDTLFVEAEGQTKLYLNWWDLPYHIEYIRDRHLLTFGADEAAVCILPPDPAQ